MDLANKYEYVYPYEGCLEYPHASMYKRKDVYHDLLPPAAQDALKLAAELSQDCKLLEDKLALFANCEKRLRERYPEYFRISSDLIKYRGIEDMMRGERAGKIYRRPGGKSTWYQQFHNI